MLAQVFQCFVSAVAQEGEFLLVWGQKDAQNLPKLEDAINKLLHTPNIVYTPQEPSELQPNLICYAMNLDCKFYRVQIKSTFSTLATLHSIDYGFDFCTDFRNVRLLRTEDPFKSYPPAAEKYYLAGALIRGTLSQEEQTSMHQCIVGSLVYVTVVAQNRATGARFVSLHSQVGLNFLDAFNRFDKMIEVQVQIQDQRMTESQRGPSEFLRAGAVSAKISSSPVVSPAPTPQPPVVPVPKAVPPAHPPAAEPRFLTTIPPPKALKVDAQHKVTVSDATNGPWSFSVQIADDFKALERLTEEIQRVDKVPMRAPFNISRPCIVFHPIQRVYARAILVSEGDRNATVAFIDYGDSGTTSIREVFEIPQKLLKTQQLSQKFRMAGLPSMKPGTEEYQRLITLFRKIVPWEEYWYLRVTQTEEGCSQNCEMYDEKGCSIKGLVNDEKKRLLKLSLAYTADEFPEVGQSVPVYISHVNNSASFFVQTKMREEDCNAVQAELQAVCGNSPRLTEARVNSPCIALFEDGIWYRARILSIDKNKVKLSFVDYGNETEQNLGDLKELPINLIQYPAMGLHCSLERVLSDETEFHGLVNEDGVEAVVTSVENNKMLVKITHNGRDIAARKPGTPAQNYPAALNTAPAPADDSWGDNTMLPNSGGVTNEYQQPSNADGGRRKYDDSDNSRGFKNRQEGGGGFRSREDSDGGFKKFGGDDGGFKNFGADDGGFKKFGGDDGGFKKFGGDDGGFKKFGDEDSGGFRKRRDDDRAGGGDAGARPDRPMRTPVRYDERAEAGSEWPEQVLDPGTEWDVTITSFFTPDNFYVQQTPNSPEFVAMVEGIQTDYSNKFGFKRTEPPQVSDIVIAKFSEDRVLYRGEVTVADPLRVRFVDYGNVDSINDNRDVYPVMRKLMDLPKQAVRCKLAGVKPAGGKWVSSAADYFDKEQLKCTFVSVEDGLYSVKLSWEGQDVGEQLKQAGQAVDASADDTVPASVAASPAKESSPSEPDSPKFSTIVPSNLNGDAALMLVSYVEGVERFFVHPDPASIRVMEELIAAAMLIPLSIEPAEGVMCIAGLGADSRYRAQIAEITETGAWVHFIDYGDSAEIPLTELYEIPDRVKSLPALAIDCTLHGDVSLVSDEAQDKFKEQYEQKNVVILCHSVSDDGRLSVTVYDERGVKANIDGWVNDAPGVSTIPQLVLPASEMTVYVLELTGPNTCLISLPNVSQPDMNSLYTDLDDSLQVEVGSRCAVKCADGTWRRTVRPAEKECYLVDVGRSEVASEFRPLAPQFVTVPAAVREVSFTWPILGNQLVKVTRKKDTYQIEPVAKTGFVMHVESVTEIYVQSESVIAKIDEIGEMIAQSVPADLGGAELFAAKFPDDDQWYRAQATDPADPLKVLFVDYGNSSQVTEVAPLAAELLKLPPLAVRIELHAGIPETAFDELYAILTGSETALQLVEEDAKVVDLLQEGKSIADKVLKRRPLKAGEVVYLSHIENPGLFFVQRHADSAELDELTAKLMASVDGAQVVEAADVGGKLVAAKFVDDEAWYRAVVEENMVWFVDHGNKAELLELRELSADLADAPPLAVKASLVHPQGAEWSQPAIDAFFNFLDSRPLTVSSAVWQNGAYSVVLNDEGEDIIAQLPTADADSAEASTEVSPGELLTEETEVHSSNDQKLENGSVQLSEDVDAPQASEDVTVEEDNAAAQVTADAVTTPDVSDELPNEEKNDVNGNQANVASDDQLEVCSVPLTEDVIQDNEDFTVEENAQMTAEVCLGELPNQEETQVSENQEIPAANDGENNEIENVVNGSQESADAQPEAEVGAVEVTADIYDEDTEDLDSADLKAVVDDIITGLCQSVEDVSKVEANTDTENLTDEPKTKTDDLSENPLQPEQLSSVPTEAAIDMNGKIHEEVPAKDAQESTNLDKCNGIPKGNDSCSDTLGDMSSSSPTTDPDSPSINSEGFQEEVAPKKNLVESATAQTFVEKKAKTRVEEKIVPGAISRGIDFSSK